MGLVWNASVSCNICGIIANFEENYILQWFSLGDMLVGLLRKSKQFETTKLTGIPLDIKTISATQATDTKSF